MRRQPRRIAALAFILLVAGFILAPVTVELLAPDRSGPSENRKLASWPQWPASWASAGLLPAGIDLYVRDHFGLRYEMIAAANRLRFGVFHALPSERVVAGESGRLFLTSHDGRPPYSLIDTVCGIGVSDAATEAQAVAITGLLRRLPRQQPRTMLVIIPSSPAIYPEDLPPWLRRRCEGARPTVARIAARLPADVLPGFDYPLGESMTIKPALEIYPRQNFHWAGEAVGQLMQHVAEQRLGLARRLRIPTMREELGTDLRQFTLGLWMSSTVDQPDWKAAGIEACEGPACLPELGAAGSVISEMSRFRSSAGPGRLLLISDSFGKAAAGYFAAYVGEVQHFSTNFFADLSPAQVAEVRDHIANRFKPDVVILLYHDGNVIDDYRVVSRLLAP